MTWRRVCSSMGLHGEMKHTVGLRRIRHKALICLYLMTVTLRDKGYNIPYTVLLATVQFPVFFK